MLMISSWLCPKCTFILFYTTLNLKACKINYQKKCVTFLWGWGVGGLQKNVRTTFLVDKIDMCSYYSFDRISTRQKLFATFLLGNTCAKISIRDHGF